jgi:hypothetical protein
MGISTNCRNTPFTLFFLDTVEYSIFPIYLLKSKDYSDECPQFIACREIERQLRCRKKVSKRAGGGMGCTSRWARN